MDILITASDFVIFLAYFAIPIELVCFLPKVISILNNKLIFTSILFILFILLCGLTHLFSAFVKNVILECVTKILTALVSIVTAFVLGMVVVPDIIGVPMMLKQITNDNIMMIDYRKVTQIMRTKLEYDSILRNSLCVLKEIHPYMKFHFSMEQEDHDELDFEENTERTMLISNTVTTQNEINITHSIPVNKHISLIIEYPFSFKLPYSLSWFYDVGTQMGIAIQQSKLISKALRTSQLKSEFLSLVSHELRTPLTGIVNVGDLLSMTSLNKEQKDYVKTIKHCGKLLLTLISDILDFSKIEANKLTLDNIPFDINKILTDAEHLFRPTLKTKNITFDIYPIDNAPTLVGDPARIQQVLTNLTNNAIKFTNHGYVKVVPQIIQENGNYFLTFDIIDTGIGIEEDRIKHLFQPFSQGDTSIYRTYGGTGLGLAICKKLIALMKGQITLQSKVNEGSTFHFSIPVSIGGPLIPEPNLIAPVKALASPNSVSILFAEDNPINQQVIMKILQKLGYSRIHMVSNGREALDMYLSQKEKNEAFDIILLDNAMPFLSGIDVCKHIRNEIKDKTQVIIFITADISITFMKPENLFNDFITKPIKLSVLKEKLNRWSTK